MSKPYTTTDEMVRDMNSPQYRNDPNFRAAVEGRMAAGDVAHGGRVIDDSGIVDFGRRGTARSAGGLTIRSGSGHWENGSNREVDHRHAASIDSTAIYSGSGFHSAEQLREAFADPRYSRDAAFRAQVAAAVELMGPAHDFKV